MIEELFKKHNELYNKSMWMNHGYEKHRPTPYLKRTSAFIDREFQIKYAMTFGGFCLLCMLVVMIPAYFLIAHNYEIFIDLAYKNSPDLIRHFEREKLGFLTLFAALFLGVGLFMGVLSFRATSKLVGPIKVLTNHLRQLSRGNWAISPIKVRESDEFQELVEVYNYFFLMQKVNLTEELNQLQIALNADPREKQKIMQKILRARMHQLSQVEQLGGLESIDRDGVAFGSHVSQNVS